MYLFSVNSYLTNLNSWNIENINFRENIIAKVTSYMLPKENDCLCRFVSYACESCFPTPKKSEELLCR